MYDILINGFSDFDHLAILTKKILISNKITVILTEIFKIWIEMAFSSKYQSFQPNF